MNPNQVFFIGLKRGGGARTTTMAATFQEFTFAPFCDSRYAQGVSFCRHCQVGYWGDTCEGCGHAETCPRGHSPVAQCVCQWDGKDLEELTREGQKQVVTWLLAAPAILPKDLKRMIARHVGDGQINHDRRDTSLPDLDFNRSLWGMLIASFWQFAGAFFVMLTLIAVLRLWGVFKDLVLAPAAVGDGVFMMLLVPLAAALAAAFMNWVIWLIMVPLGDVAVWIIRAAFHHKAKWRA
jgi:multisubunit Na+/H+ antiporter MnhG subunit